MAHGVVGVPSGGDESASLLEDDDGSPVLFAAGTSSHPSPPPPPLHGKATTRTPAGHAFTRLIRSPFAAVRRMTTCADTDAISPSVEQPTSKKKTAAGAVVVEHRREAKRRPSLEQLIMMETTAPPPLPTTPSRPGHRSKPDTTTSSKVSIRTTTVKEKRAHEPLSLPKTKSHRAAVVVSDNERRCSTPALALFKSDADADAGDRRATAKRLVVVFESLRACSRASGIAVEMPTKGLSRKKVSAAGSCVPASKAELFYYRPIPMGRRCRVQHLEETPYK